MSERKNNPPAVSAAVQKPAVSAAVHEQTAPAKDCSFVITRLLDAPRELVWKVWTTEQHMMKWWGPKGFGMLSSKMDLRPGGVFHYGMRAPDGRDMWGKWIFREVAAPTRLVFVSSFSDAACGLTRHPFAPDWPLETLSIMTLAEQGKKTLLTLQWRPLSPTAAEQKVFDEGHGSMQQGWSGVFEQLEGWLADPASKK